MLALNKTLSAAVLIILVSMLNGLVASAQSDNFVRTEEVRISGAKTDDQVLGLTSDQKITSYSYFDGFGRSTQTISKQGSPSKSDLVVFSYYDASGRPTRNYLPYKADANTGSLRVDAIQEVNSFYQVPPAGFPADTKPYGSADFEASPLNRIKSSTSVGGGFQSKNITSRVGINDEGAVRKWDLVNGLPRSTGSYPAGSLTFKEVVDAAGQSSRKYLDFVGREVLTQTQDDATTWLSTYYVYSDYGELLFIIPPAASSNLTPDPAYANLWYFRYEYDHLGRLTGSKSPGTGWVYTVFDQWDRPVLTQDGEQRGKATPEWSFVKYDGLNRAVVFGRIATTATRAALTTAVAGASVRDELTTTSNLLGYTLNRTYPTTATEANIDAVTYYDNYSFLDLAGWSPNNSKYAFAALAGFTGVRTTAVKGLVTGTKTKTQGSNAYWLYSVMHYDKFGQIIQTVGSNQLGGYTRLTSNYSFAGEVTKSLAGYTYTAEGVPASTTIQRRFKYDHAGRLTRLYHQVDNEAEVLLSATIYNEIGYPVTSVHHSRNDGATFLYEASHAYTIQGWAKKMRYKFPEQTNIFTEELDYENVLVSGQSIRFDGLISAIKWKHGVDAGEAAYTYNYDKPKRLTHASFSQKAEGASTWTNSNFYTEGNIQYDANGNILDLVRRQEITSASALIDKLAYVYSGNTLLSVTDNATTSKAKGFVDGNTSGSDYTYNPNGSLTSDKNKGITSISYTRTGHPSRIDFVNGSNIRYTYTAGGALLTVTYHDTATGAATRRRNYVGELVFETNEPLILNHELGRVLMTAGQPRYQYYLVDHLGNMRVTLQEDPAQFTSVMTGEPSLAANESQRFINYEESDFVSAALFDHTGMGESQRSVRLTGHGNGEERTGPAKSVSVMTGDTVRFSVYGKFIDRRVDNPKIAALLAAMTTTTLVTAGEAAVLANGTGTPGGLSALLTGGKQSNDSPPAYLNYLFFDQEMNFKTGGYVQMTDAAREDGSDVPHEKMAMEVVASEPGYYYVYLSNSGQAWEEAYFDDFTLTLSQSYIIQTTDYYPYGMVARSFVRSGELATNELFQGKRYEELAGWYDFHARQYDGVIGRFWSNDPANQFASGYVGMGNSPINGTDPDGQWFGVDDLVAAAVGGVINLTVNAIQGNLRGDNVWESIGKGAAAFTAGAASGTLALYGPAGWAAGGAIVGGTNAWLGGAQGWDIAKGAGIGVVSGVVGGAGGQIGSSLGKLVINGTSISSPVVNGLVNGIFGGALGGGLGGGTASWLSGGNFWDGFQSGAITGGVLGGGLGAGTAYAQSVRNGVNPWTGKNNSPGSTGIVGQNAIEADGFTRPNNGLQASDESWRYLDGIKGDIGVEAKTGYLRESPFVRKQLWKDYSILETQQLKTIEWRFYRSPVTGKIGYYPNFQNQVNQYNQLLNGNGKIVIRIYDR